MGGGSGGTGLGLRRRLLNYAANWQLAGTVFSSVVAAQESAGCGEGAAGGLAGAATSDGLPGGLPAPDGHTSRARGTAVAYALAELGKPYVWGAVARLLRLLGLTMAAWAVARVPLGHYTVDQLHEGQPIDPAAATAGDLVLVPGTDPPGPGLPGHVGIYLGDRVMLSAVDPQQGVVVQTWAAFTAGGLDAVVDPAPGG